jgi:UDP-N-acetylglucosamine--N-acetylmuramyl-(pentapeptide) pyrophosphoryl-undecaprenol N-acetylglucosamine transferase
MTIAFTGGETGGHFYPLIAIAEALHDMAREQNLLAPKLYFLAPSPFDQQALFENEIVFIRVPAGKMRRYRSFANFTDLFVTFGGFLQALVTLFRIYPDVLVSKGGFGSVPSTMAARFLGIPVVIHESDAKPGRANLMASKWATRVAISFDSAAPFFPKKVQKKIARTGIPIRKELTRVELEGAREYLGLDAQVPTILILGGSLGSQRINNVVMDALPELLTFANVIHQTGPANFDEVNNLSKVVLAKSPDAARYHPFNYLSAVSLQRAAGAASVVVSRAGATAVAEIALWAKPAVLIPIPESVSHDQRSNAYAYAATGAAVVLEEANLTPHLLVSETKRIATDPTLAAQMAAHATSFADPDAARVLAGEILQIALTHES